MTLKPYISGKDTAQALCSLALFGFLIFGSPAQAASYRDSMEEGLNAYEEGEYQAALKHFTDAQLEKPEQADVLYNLGNAYYKAEDYDTALHYFQEALKHQDALDTPDPSLRQKIYYNLGNTHFRKQTLDESLKHYEEALKIDPNDAPTRQNIEYVKKVKEQQEQQQQKQPGDQENKEDPKEESQKGENQQQEDGKGSPSDEEKGKPDQNDSGEEEPKSSYGKEMDEERQASGDNTDPKEPPETEPQSAQAASGESPDQTEQKKQAERALNRLKDQPGRATMPRYGERDVERDW